MGITMKGMQETQRWLRTLPAKLKSAAVEATTSSDALGAMETRARADVLAVVYAAYSPKVYQRTFELLAAVGAVKLDVEPPELAAAGIVINLTDGVKAKLEEDVSYARFFLPQEAGLSFLRNRPGVPYLRDFFSAWEDAFGELIPLRLAAAIDKELAK